jgi:hypothetical protein
MISKPLRLAAAFAAGAIVLVPVFGAAGARPVARTVHLRGTAYEFNNVRVLLKGATIRVAEFPTLTATVQADGRYDLVVPDHATITPYIVDPGYHTIYLQTFTTHGEDLVNVNFQTSRPIPSIAPSSRCSRCVSTLRATSSRARSSPPSTRATSVI